ncbi:hypothetical protein FKM82_018767 [Ascaphus truei]
MKSTTFEGLLCPCISLSYVMVKYWCFFDRTRTEAPRVETKSLSSSYQPERLSGSNRPHALKPKRSHRKADPDAAHRPRILEMDKEENRRSVLLPKQRRRSNFSSENYWRRSYEYVDTYEDTEEDEGSPARKVKMRRH